MSEPRLVPPDPPTLSVRASLLHEAADEIERTTQGNAARRVKVQTLIDSLRGWADVLAPQESDIEEGSEFDGPTPL